MEQQRFAAGQQIYATRCQGCHQATAAASRSSRRPSSDSAWRSAPRGRHNRILLHGKEGAVGLMPPLGAAMTDERVAAVLTYIRRAWGQPASPVDAATVREIRAQTAGRNRPWTAEELARIGGQ